jgi:DNA-binding response OmpR family regulator
LSPASLNAEDVSGGRILVVDDNPTVRKLALSALGEAGFAVSELEGRSLTAALEEERPSLVLLGDVAEPGAAEDFFATLRARGTAIPVVLLSLSDEGTAPPREVVNVVRKPFSPEALRVVVEQALRKRDDAAPVPATDLGSLSLVPVEEDKTEPEAWLGNAALTGDLAIFSLTDILALLETEAQTGTLAIRRADARLNVYFSSGRIDLATAEGVPEDFLLGKFLVRGQALAAATLAAALEVRAKETAAGNPPLLGRYLVERGYIGEPALRRVLALQTAALVFESLRWGAGKFAFTPAAAVPALAKEAALGLAVPALLLEGFRRVEEWRVIEREVGDFDVVFMRDEERLAAFGRGRLTREEQSVLDLCDGRRTVREVIERSQLGAFDTTKMLYRLARTRLIRRRVAPVAVPA